MVKPTEPRPKGIACPVCHAPGPRVVNTDRPCPGVVVRYRRCRRCRARLVSRETVIRTRPPKTSLPVATDSP